MSGFLPYREALVAFNMFTFTAMVWVGAETVKDNVYLPNTEPLLNEPDPLQTSSPVPDLKRRN